MKEKDYQAKDGHKLVMYVEKEDRSYGPLQTSSWMVSTYFDDLVEKRRHLAEELRRRLLAGEISPVAYYMTLIDIAEADLALRVGISRRKLRRHLTPRGFAGIDLALAQKYAEVFAVPLANLFQVLDDGGGTTAFAQERTANPLVAVTRAAVKPK